MPRRPAILTQADVRRVIRAAKQEGAGNVTVKPDGSILISLSPSTTGPENEAPEAEREIVL